MVQALPRAPYLLIPNVEYQIPPVPHTSSQFITIVRVTIITTLFVILGNIYVPVISQQLIVADKTNKDTLISQTLPPASEKYELVIPKLNIEEPIIENVNVTQKKEYLAALNYGIAKAAGTSLPGQPGIHYYFAHSSGKPELGSRAATFANLNQLEQGDRVYIYRNYSIYPYFVTKKQIVPPTDVSTLTATTPFEQVVLQTCWPLGTDWQRLLVIAEPIK